MTDAVIACAFGLALFAAARSCWSPCGLSMLSSITPLGERGRNQRFGVTAAAYVVGGILGGATLGGVLAALAAGVHSAGLTPTTVVLVAAAVAALGAAVDLGLAGIRLPLLRRQVNELWLDRYRGWIYGLGFGWQIGVGFTTYLMTAGVVVVCLLAALGGSPLLAFLVGLTFGSARGLSVLAARGATTPDRLVAIHQRFAALRRPVWIAAASAQVAVAAALAALVWAPAAAVVAVAAVGVVALLRPSRVARLAGESS